MRKFNISSKRASDDLKFHRYNSNQISTSQTLSPRKIARFNKLIGIYLPNVNQSYKESKGSIKYDTALNVNNERSQGLKLDSRLEKNRNHAIANSIDLTKRIITDRRRTENIIAVRNSVSYETSSINTQRKLYIENTKYANMLKIKKQSINKNIGMTLTRLRFQETLNENITCPSFNNNKLKENTRKLTDIYNVRRMQNNRIENHNKKECVKYKDVSLSKNMLEKANTTHFKDSKKATSNLYITYRYR